MFFSISRPRFACPLIGCGTFVYFPPFAIVSSAVVNLGEICLSPVVLPAVCLGVHLAPGVPVRPWRAALLLPPAVHGGSSFSMSLTTLCAWIVLPGVGRYFTGAVFP